MSKSLSFKNGLRREHRPKRWILDDGDAVAALLQLAVDTLPAGAGDETAVNENEDSAGVAKVATMTARDVDRLVQDTSIMRNRGNIEATVDNARAMMSASPSLVALAKSYEITRKRAPRSIADYPSRPRMRRRSRSS